MADDTKNPALTNVTPWGLHPVPGFVRDTLKKRPKSYAWHSSTEKDTGAVRTAWARVCSNGRTPSHNNLEGFILFGPNTDTSSGPIGFNESFGFGSDGKQVIGRDANNSPHTLSPVTFPHRPPPAMLSIETEFYGAGSSFPGLCKKSTIKWKCFSKEQLEYITPYFLSLSVTVVIEWGWNNYSAKSLINLADKTELLQMFSAGKSYYNRIVDSGGDYDCHVGRIIDYGYTMDNRGNYEGYTVVVNPSFMMEGVNIKDQTGVTDDKNSASCAVDFIKNRFDNLATTKDKLITQFYGKEFQLAWLINRNNWIFVRPDEKFPEIKPDAKFWINMRGLQAIFNLFGSIKYGGRHVDLTFRFANAKIGAHPLIKAVCAGSDNKNVSVLIPNANAPRLMRKATDKASKQSLKSVTDPNADPRWKNTVSSLSNAMSEQFKFTDETDNLKSAINSANPFPMLVGGGYIPNDDPALGKGPVTGSISGIDPIYNAAKPGYWGFLGDIYVSNTLVKTAFTQNDTLQRALEYILGEISSAGSNFWEFRVIPEAPNNITVIDSSFCPVTSGPEADNENIVNFEIGRTEDSCFTTYGMSVQMKQEMATQTLLGNNSSVDAKGQMVSAFTSGDRLFMTSGSFDYVAESEDEKTDKAKQTEATDKAVDVYNKGRETDKGCVIWQRGDDKYYLVEKDPEVMKKIVALGERPGTSAKPLSTPMMPGTEFTFECQGISGFAFLGMFTLSSVPTPYDREHAVFQVDGVKNVIAENNWKTSITAKVRPLLSTGAANK